jgi:hypothetical protein
LDAQVTTSFGVCSQQARNETKGALNLRGYAAWVEYRPLPAEARRSRRFDEVAPQDWHSTVKFFAKFAYFACYRFPFVGSVLDRNFGRAIGLSAKLASRRQSDLVTPRRTSAPGNISAHRPRGSRETRQ